MCHVPIDPQVGTLSYDVTHVMFGADLEPYAFVAVGLRKLRLRSFGLLIHNLSP
jgi:hypothetical protein